VAVLWGCSQSDTPRLPEADFFVAQGSPFLLRLGESVGVQTPSSFVIVQVSDILGDSRCPATVTCVDAGFVRIRLAVQTALAVQEVDIDVPPGGDVQVDVEEVTVDIIAVRPEAMEGVTIDIVDYEVGMRVVQTGDIGIPQ
jgi:hypothetical protein